MSRLGIEARRVGLVLRPFERLVMCGKVFMCVGRCDKAWYALGTRLVPRAHSCDISQRHPGQWHGLLVHARGMPMTVSWNGQWLLVKKNGFLDFWMFSKYEEVNMKY